jgi:hypothetical protein
MAGNARRQLISALSVGVSNARIERDEHKRHHALEGSARTQAGSTDGG